MGDPGLLTGAMRAYYEALHHAPYCNPDKIHAAFADECIVGGYDPWGTPILSKEEMSANAHKFGYGLATYIPACVGMRYETIIDDGSPPWPLGLSTRPSLPSEPCSELALKTQV